MRPGRPIKREEDKALPSDRIKCDVCNIIYTRSGKTLHNRTRIHQLCLKTKKEEKKIPDNIKTYICDMYGELFLRDNEIEYLNNPVISYNKKILLIDNIINGVKLQ